MKVFEGVAKSVKTFGGKTKARVSKRSPELLLIAGGVTFVATVVVACKQTLKCEEILDEHQRKMDDIENCLEMAAEEDSSLNYTEEEARKDRFIAYCQTGLGFARVYAPAILLGVVSITCFGSSFSIMKKRNLAITAAYTAVDSAFKEYRKKVKEELGEDTDKYFRYGYKKVKNAVIAGKDENGEIKAVKSKEAIDTVPWDENVDCKWSNGDKGIFLFAPETSTRFRYGDEVHNDMTISSVRNIAQVNYSCQGYMFLNTILKELGISEIPYGQLIGWLKGNGDDYIDFGVKKVYRPMPKDPARNPFGLDYECVYELEFNTCGVIWDKI